MINCKKASITTIQKALAVWQETNFHQYFDSYEGNDNLTEHLKYGVIEEIGELFHAILKDAQGIRGTHTEHLDAMRDAIGDALVYVAQLYSWSHMEFELQTVGESNASLTYHAAEILKALDDDDYESVVNNIEWIADMLEFDSEDCFRFAAEQVLARDWIKYPETGKPASDAARGSK